MVLGGGGGDQITTPLLHPKRHGTVWTATAHIITAVIGSGVLSLTWSMAQLGWAAGPAATMLFAAVTGVQSSLFADCYRSPDPEHGHHRNKTYFAAVHRNLGAKSAWICMFFQKISLFGYGIAYTITAAISFRSCKEGTMQAAFVRGKPWEERYGLAGLLGSSVAFWA